MSYLVQKHGWHELNLNVDPKTWKLLKEYSEAKGHPPTTMAISLIQNGLWDWQRCSDSTTKEESMK